MKDVRIRRFSDTYFPAFEMNTERYPYSVQMWENADQKNSEYGPIFTKYKPCTFVLAFLTSFDYLIFLSVEKIAILNGKKFRISPLRLVISLLATENIVMI